MKPKLKPPGSKRLKLNWDILLSNFAFKFNLRRCNPSPTAALASAFNLGRGLHSSTFQLNLSRF